MIMKESLEVVQEAKFLASYTDWKKLPPPQLPEYAVIGRSNVGKSSLINALCGRKSLAKISQTPGKTQTINIFLIENTWFLVDLPGYGYSKVSKAKRLTFNDFSLKYLLNRPNLMLTFVLIDARLSPLSIDIEFINQLGSAQVPLALVFTKADKEGIHRSKENIKLFHQKMLETWEEPPQTFLTSAETGYGTKELLKFILKTNTLFNKP